MHVPHSLSVLVRPLGLVLVDLILHLDISALGLSTPPPPLSPKTSTLAPPPDITPITDCYPPPRELTIHTFINRSLCLTALNLLSGEPHFSQPRTFGPQPVAEPMSWISGNCHIELGSRDGTKTANFSYEDVYATAVQIFDKCDTAVLMPPGTPSFGGYGGISDVAAAGEERVWFVQVYGIQGFDILGKMQ